MTSAVIAVLSILGLAAVFFVASLYLIKPNRRRNIGAFSNGLIAHRGLHGNGIPENSLKAFKMAAAKGLGVELDVQLTKDNKLVVFHDKNTGRMCGKDLAVCDVDYDDLLELRLSGTDEIIPLFSDVLGVLDGVPIICELKYYSGYKNTEVCKAAYAQLIPYKGEWCVESFSPYLVRWFRRYHPEVVRGQLAKNILYDREGISAVKAFALSNLFINFLSRPDFIAYGIAGNRPFFFRLARYLFRPHLVGWTARGNNQIQDVQNEFPLVIFENDWI